MIHSKSLKYIIERAELYSFIKDQRERGIRWKVVLELIRLKFPKFKLNEPSSCIVVSKAFEAHIKDALGNSIEFFNIATEIDTLSSWGVSYIKMAIYLNSKEVGADLGFQSWNPPLLETIHKIYKTHKSL